jgi:hypothetical protein
MGAEIGSSSEVARVAGGVIGVPEVNVALFAFLLNFVWEFWQTPFYREMPTAPHWEAVKFCTWATLGDATIMLVAFGAVAAATRSRTWILEPTALQVIGFVVIGILITVVVEWIGTEIVHRWSYAERMPTLPLLGTGIVPLIQWMLLPPLVVWFVRRQLT